MNLQRWRIVVAVALGAVVFAACALWAEEPQSPLEGAAQEDSARWPWRVDWQDVPIGQVLSEVEEHSGLLFEAPSGLLARVLRETSVRYSGTFMNREQLLEELSDLLEPHGLVCVRGRQQGRFSVRLVPFRKGVPMALVLHPPKGRRLVVSVARGEVVFHGDRGAMRLASGEQGEVFSDRSVRGPARIDPVRIAQWTRQPIEGRLERRRAILKELNVPPLEVRYIGEDTEQGAPIIEVAAPAAVREIRLGNRLAEVALEGIGPQRVLLDSEKDELVVYLKMRLKLSEREQKE